LLIADDVSHQENSLIPTPGKRAPNFTALTDADSQLELSSLRGKIVVLFFYPKDDTSG
jgi:peroxiredoxin Q/BCP